MTELRSSPRVSTYLNGRVTHHAQLTVWNCLVRNVSAGGARLIFQGAALVPNTIVLHVPRLGLRSRAQVRWRHGDECGVKFME
jgi:hypothetical protein